MRQGGASNHFFLLVSGSINVMTKLNGLEGEQIVNTLHPGDYFGETGRKGAGREGEGERKAGSEQKCSRDGRKGNAEEREKRVREVNEIGRKQPY